MLTRIGEKGGVAYGFFDTSRHILAGRLLVHRHGDSHN